MSTVDAEADGTVAVHTKGAPETVVPWCTTIAEAGGGHRDITALDRTRLAGLIDDYAAQGLRMLAIARRRLDGDAVTGSPAPTSRTGCVCSGWSRCSTLPGCRSSTRSPRRTAPGSASTWSPGTTASPRPRSPAASGSARRAPVVTGEQLDALSEPELDHLLPVTRKSSSPAAHPRRSCASPTRCGPRGRSWP